MTQLLGASRMGASFQSQIEGTAKEQQLLTLYQQPATIRDMHQTFFYVEALADLVYFDPLTYFYGLDPNWSPDGPLGGVTGTTQDMSKYPFAFMKSPYFGAVGTEKKFNIVDKINNLLDLRVDKDKYVFEINLAEAVIEADSSNWINIPDQVVRRGIPLDNTAEHPFGTGNPVTEYDNINIDKTYKQTLDLKDTSTGDPPLFDLAGSLDQATKQSQPQTLYCRIKELSNGEPYNWAVTNSGAYSIDKGHQLLVRHGDITAADLTLEYGHILFLGKDRDETIYFGGESTDAKQESLRIAGERTDDQFTQKQRYGNVEYVDYNREVFNVKPLNWPHMNFRSKRETTDPALPDAYVTMIDDSTQYPDFYFGATGRWPYRFGIDGANPGVSVINDNVKSNIQSDQNIEDRLMPPNVPKGKNYNEPISRPPFVTQFLPVVNDSITATTNPANAAFIPYLLQGRPLLFNQQASKIGFRFAVRIIHTF